MASLNCNIFLFKQTFPSTIKEKTLTMENDIARIWETLRSELHLSDQNLAQSMSKWALLLLISLIELN